VTEVIDCPAHPVLGLTLTSGGEVLVPFVSAAVPTVVLAEGYLVLERAFVDLDAGDPARP
jgi:ribosomal 30S subunit maturation factor RimM